MSFCGFIAATASAVEIMASLIYSKAIGGFAYYDPRLMRIYRWGELTALTALVLALAGMRGKNPLRWLSLGSAFGTLAFWLTAAEGE